VKIRITTLDKLFSKYIRTRDKWTCQKCGRKYDAMNTKGLMGLHCAHTFSRRHKLTRFDTENADALCFGCHQYLGERPLEHYEWKKARIGEKRFNELSIRHRVVGKINEELVMIRLRQLLKDLGQ